MPLPSLISAPITIGNVEVPNRLMMTVHSARLSQRRYLRYLEERVAGGVGLVGLAAAGGLYNLPLGPGRFMPQYGHGEDVVPAHPLTAEGIAFYDNAIATLREHAEVIHRGGARCVGQLYHPGASRHIDGSQDNFQPAYAPSNVPDEFRRNMPHAMTGDEIADVVAAFGHAGRRVAEAGIDGIELHGAHGYLINEFLSPYHNHRTDSYGGSLDNRMRFLLEVVAGLRTFVGDDYPIGIRLNGGDLIEGGLTNEDMEEIARRAEAAGLAYISISGGTYGGLRQGLRLPYVAAPSFDPVPNIEHAAAIRQVVDVPVIVGCRIVDIEAAERILADGAADMVGMTRALIADANILRKSLAGRPETVTPCIGCNECHYGRPLSYAVNAAAGREEEMDPTPVATPSTVLIVGAGPAGLECARVAALRGHHVVLCDRDDHLGGTISTLARDSFQADFQTYVDHLALAVAGLGVDTRLGVEIDPAAVVSINPGAIVLATGAVDRRPPLAGAGGGHVWAGIDVFAGRADLGARVLVVGGIDDHLPPLTTADLAARSGHDVTLISELLHPGQRIEGATVHGLTRRLLQQGVRLVPMTALVAVDGDHVEVRNTLTHEHTRLGPFDSVVLAAERFPDDRLAAPLVAAGHRVRLIGDCLAPRRLIHATMDGARMGLELV